MLSILASGFLMAYPKKDPTPSEDEIREFQEYINKSNKNKKSGNHRKS
jgi:hypothetical protein